MSRRDGNEEPALIRNVLQAAAKVREAYLADRRTALPAPVDGYVAKRTVQGAYKGELFVSPCIAGLGNK